MRARTHTHTERAREGSGDPGLEIEERKEERREMIRRGERV